MQATSPIWKFSPLKRHVQFGPAAAVVVQAAKRRAVMIERLIMTGIYHRFPVTQNLAMVQVSL